jgi:hypothetical protein
MFNMVSLHLPKIPATVAATILILFLAVPGCWGEMDSLQITTSGTFGVDTFPGSWQNAGSSIIPPFSSIIPASSGSNISTSNETLYPAEIVAWSSDGEFTVANAKVSYYRLPPPCLPNSSCPMIEVRAIVLGKTDVNGKLLARVPAGNLSVEVDSPAYSRTGAGEWYYFGGGVYDFSTVGKVDIVLANRLNGIPL